MTTPDDAHWVTIDVDTGQVTFVTLVACQNFCWTVETEDRTYVGHYC